MNTSLDLTKLSPVAHRLARINRWCGAGQFTISVARHSVLVSLIAEELSNSERVHKQALLHDVAEAVIGDVPAPLALIVPELRKYETLRLNEVFRHFDIPENMHPAVAEADKRAANLEATALRGQVGGIESDYVGLLEEASYLYRHRSAQWANQVDVELFLSRAEELGLPLG